jgi:hypothetical protein
MEIQVNTMIPSKSAKIEITGKVHVTIERTGKDTFRLIRPTLGEAEHEILIGDTLTIIAPFYLLTEDD